MILLQDLIARVGNEDSYAAVELLCREGDGLGAAKTFSEAANHFYWKEKDLVSSVAMGRAGVQHALSAAACCDPGDLPLAFELRGQAKAMAYNIASFTWSGWDEPGIVIGPSDLATGLDAARTNLRLGTELKKVRSLCRGHIGCSQPTSWRPGDTKMHGGIYRGMRVCRHRPRGRRPLAVGRLWGLDRTAGRYEQRIRERIEATPAGRPSPIEASRRRRDVHPADTDRRARCSRGSAVAKKGRLSRRA